MPGNKISGVIFYNHSKKIYRQAMGLRPKRFAILYTGKKFEDMAVVL